MRELRKYGKDWSVRQVITKSEGSTKGDMIINKLAAGRERRHKAVITRAKFTRWAQVTNEGDMQ